MVLSNPENPEASTSSTMGIPVSEIGPNERMVFSVVPMEESGDALDDPTTNEIQSKIQSDPAFTPEFYPDRFNKVLEKELNKNGQQCQGQDVSIKNFQNAKLHATGVALTNEISTLENLHNHDGVVDLYTPISPNGGLEAIVKKVELGELEGWNPHFDMWMFNYTLDLVSTGRDEYGGNDGNEIISSTLEEENAPDITDSDSVQS